MENIYYEKRYLKEIDTVVTDILNCSGKISISLEKNIFFPGGGGQPKDEGSISFKKINSDVKILDIVSEDEILEEKSDMVSKNDIINRSFGYSGLSKNVLSEEESGKNMVSKDKSLDIDESLNKSKIFLVLDLDFEVFKDNLNIDDELRASINWDRRIDFMQQHTGQHLLSGSFFNLFNRNTLSLHIGSEFTQLDIEGSFSDSMVQEVEDFANQCILKRLEIKNYELNRNDVPENLTRRPLPNDDERIRILEIDGVDINACCGVHCKNTSDIQFIKIKKYYRHKGGTRFEFLAGGRAINYILKKERVFDRVLNKYNSGFDNIENTLENIKEKSQKYFDSMKYYSERYFESLYNSIIEEERFDLGIDDLKLIKIIFQEEDRSFLSNFSDYVVKNDRAILFLANIREEYIDIRLEVDKKIAKKNNKINLGKDFRHFSELVDAKGGGSNFLAQGIGYNKKNVDIYLDKIYSIYMR